MKERLDILLINKGLVTGRDRAKAVIMSGAVYVDGYRHEICKPGRVQAGKGVGGVPD